MKTQPRINRRRLSLFVLLVLLHLLVLLLCSAPTLAQKRTRSRPKPASQALEAERARKRAKAIALLAETAEEARALDDLLYRARLQSLAADALWPYDSQRAQALFRRSWEAATAFDKSEQEAAAQEAGTTTDAVEPETAARDEVLARTAARDPALASIFLRDLMKSSQQSETSERDEQAAGQGAWRTPSAAAYRRIELGLELLEQGEAASAYKIVAPVANEGVTAPLISFLRRLQERDAAAAENLYRLLIANTRRDPTADANTILLLSTPIVSPDLMVAIDEYGTLQLRPIAHDTLQTATPVNFSTATRAAFFNTSAAVLLRPNPASRPGTSPTQDRAARYFAIGRLLPYFEREAAEFAPELQARSTALLNEFTESARTSLTSQLELRSVGPPPSTDPLRAHFEERARASEQSERDRITTRIILIATRNRSWDRARRAAAELSDESLRRAAYSFIAVNQVADLSNAYRDEKEDDYESIVAFLKSADLPPLAAAWGYAQAARVAARRHDSQRVSKLLTEAEHYAARVDARSPERVAAYGVIAREAARLDQLRAWELLSRLVKEANTLEDYAGDEASIEIRADETSTTETPFTFDAEVFRLDSIFATMAHLDFERSLSSARSIERAVPRLFAQLAIARAALERGGNESKPSAPGPKAGGSGPDEKR